MKKGKVIFALVISFMLAISGICTVMAAEGEVQMADYVKKSGPLGDYDMTYREIEADTANRGSVLGKKHEHGYIFWVSYNNRSYISYCIGYGRAVNGGDILERWPGKDLISASGKVISDKVIEQLEYVLKYGFILDTSYLSGATAAEQFMRDYLNDTDSQAQDKYFATQTVMWATADGYFENYDKMVQILRSFCKDKGSNTYNRAKDIYDKAYDAYNACKDERAVNFDKTYKMTWDEDEQVYKAVITESNYKYKLGDAISGQVTSSNSNLKFKVEENKITITSTKAVGTKSSPVSCTFTRKVGDNEGTAYFGQADTSKAGDDPQPLASFVASNMEDEKHNFKVYTDVGNLKIKKVDNYGVAHQGVKFTVTGNGLKWDITTGSDGTYTLSNIPTGTYTITEVSTVNGMVIDEATKTQTVKVNTNETMTYTKENSYPSGSVRLKKYDADNRGNTKGDATLEGAIYNLYAAEDIYQGSTRVYQKDEIVKDGIKTDANGDTEAVKNLPVGKYYYKEIKASEGFNINSSKVDVEIVYKGQSESTIAEVVCEASEPPIYGNIKILKRLGALDYDPEINLKGAQFKATLISDSTQVYYSNVSGEDGICQINDIPYGEYVVEECVVPPEAERIQDFTVFVEENGNTYDYTKVDNSKDMKIEVYKEILVHEGEATDAKVEGAYFTVYRDQNCTDKVCVIGPTDENGYAISGTMRTGTYYLKETTFPEGIDPDATIPDENITYRNKVYMVTADNTTQGTETIKVPITIKNEPKRNDIEIYKEIGATSNTPQFPLDQCEFTATLKSTIGTDHVFSRKCTAQTDENGYCIIEDLPYGEYIVEETKVSPISLKCDDFTIFVEEDRKVQVEPYSKNIVDTPKVMQLKIRKIDANREDTDEPDYTQGDAVLEGAIYEIYRYDPQTDAYTEKVYDIVVDHKDSEGYWCAESKDLLVGNYMIKEKISHTETVDGQTFNYSYAEGYLVDPNEYYFEQDPAAQTEERTYHYDTSREEVIRGRVEVIKYDNILGQTEEAASEGAILRLTLKSNPEKYYDLTIDKYGYGEFVEEESREKYYPYTIPYGEYEITEIKESNSGENTHWAIQPEDVIIERQVQKEYRIEADEPITPYLKVQKRDKDTGATVNLAGAEFKIWNCQENNWLELYDTSADEKITTYVTNSEGYFITPQKIQAGEYIIYETKAPEGYYLQDEWRLPTKENGEIDEEKVGVIGEGGKHVVIDKAAMDIEKNEPANTVDLYYIVDMPDEPLKGRLEIVKTGTGLLDVSIEQTEHGYRYTPVWDVIPLEGVTYEIYTAEDIKSPDGRVTYETKGTKVDTITTGSEGIAVSKELYLGEYEIREVKAPEGQIIDNDIENVVLENDNELVRVDTTTKELYNERQKLLISLEKKFKDVNFANGENIEQRAVFGVYANEDIKNVNGEIVIRKDNLIDIIEVKGNDSVTSKIDLPEGKYYVKEIETSYPYTISEEIREVEIKYDGNEREFVTYYLDGIENDYDQASLTMIKLSSSSLGDLILNGSETQVENIDEKVNQILDEIRGMTDEEIKEYLDENQIKFIPGARYKIYTDEECTKPLYIRENSESPFKEAELITNETGMIKLENIPLGSYYLKEVEAPEKYEPTNSVIKIELTQNNQNQMVYRALVENSLKNVFLTKIDIFDGQEIPNCEFEIRNDKGEVILNSITDDNGQGYIPLDLFEEGKKYTYKEISAPEIYNLNEQEFEFTAHFDEEGNWAVEKQVVENTRKTSKVTFEKIDSADQTPISNCKFELRSLETDYVLEGVTDENGLYVFEDVPYGKYTYKEVEAPEGYIIDTQEHEIEINAEDIKVRITNEKAPETGDIQVVTLAIVTVLCITGIVFISMKNKKMIINSK